MVVISTAFIVTILWSVWLWFMLVMPRRWAAFVDWEVALWVRTGLFPEKWSTKLKAMENGATLKIAACLIIAAGLTVLTFWP